MNAVARLDPAAVVIGGEPADYADTFRLTGPHPSPREAATSMLASATATGGPFARLVWNGALGLANAPGRPGTVAGWIVDVDEPDRLEVVTSGPRMDGRMVFSTTADTLTWTTALRFPHPAAAPTWRVLGPVHRALVPQLLARLR